MTNEEIKMLLTNRLDKKAASPVMEIVTPSGVDPTGISALVGKLLGTISDVEGTEEERRKINSKAELKNLLPGVSTFDYAQRRKSLSKEFNGGAGYSKGISEGSLGSLSSTVVGALVGGGLMAAFTALARKKGWGWALTNKGIGWNYKKQDYDRYKDNPAADYLQNIGIGAGAGAGISALANIIGGPVAAAITDRRDKKEQGDYEKSGLATAANYVVPGKSSYNAYKTLGYLIGESDKHRA